MSGNKDVIFLFHKLLKNKEDELPLGCFLAREGYFVVIIDMYGHGERQNSYDKLFLYDFNCLYKDVYCTASDLENIIIFLKERFGQLCFESITAVGVSIGASVALTCGYLYPQVSRVVSLLGSLDWENEVKNNWVSPFRFSSKDKCVMQYELVKNDIRIYNPLFHYEDCHKPVILFMNGLLDMTIPVKSVESTCNDFKRLYASNNQEYKVSLRLYENTGHQVTYKMIEELLKWLRLKI